MKSTRLPRITWHPLDMSDGLWYYATIKGRLRVYVRPDGSWFVKRYPDGYIFLQSDHNSCGTGIERGKLAAESYLRERLHV